MAHAGTMGLGQNTKAARSGNPWLVVAVMVAIVVATLAVWFATGSGLTSGALTARPAADHSYDQIEAQRGLVATAGDRSFDQIETLRIQAGRGPIEYDWYDQVEKPLGRVAGAGQFDAYDHAEKLQAAGFAPAVSFAGNPGAAIVPGSVVSGGSAVVVPGAYSYLQLQQMHLGATAPTISATSGTFHVGRPAVADPIVLLPGITTIDNPVKRDRVGGP